MKQGHSHTTFDDWLEEMQVEMKWQQKTMYHCIAFLFFQSKVFCKVTVKHLFRGVNEVL